MNRKLALLDIICYGIIPFLIWTHGRDFLGDYLAILLSTVPGFIYTIYRFMVEKQFNLTGLFILSSLLITTSVNLLSTSAESMLWNQVYLGFGFALIFLFTMLIRKPLGLYFAVDVAYLQGYYREQSKVLFKKRGLFICFQLLTLLFAVRGIFQNSLKAFLIHTHGVDGYSQVIIYMNVSGWIFGGLIFLGYIMTSNRIVKFLRNTTGKGA